MRSCIPSFPLLQPGMFITVEPGCYFNTITLEKHFQNPDWKPFLNEELIREKYWNVGGVRIEENVLVCWLFFALTSLPPLTRAHAHTRTLSPTHARTRARTHTRPHPRTCR